MTKNTDSDKYSYSGYGISFDVNGTFSLSNGGSTSKNVIIFDADMGSSVDVEFSIKKKYFNSWQRSNARLRRYYIAKLNTLLILAKREINFL